MCGITLLNDLIMAPKKSDEDGDTTEPNVKWKKSQAKKLFYEDLVSGKVPSTAKDENGKSTKPKLREIYNSRSEFKEYHYSKFSSRLSSMRSTVADNLKQSKTDQRAFDNYVAHHEVSLSTKNGYIQW